MASIETSLKEAMNIDGAVGVALVDGASGLTLGVMGGSRELDMNVAAAGNTDVVRAKLRTLEMLGLPDRIEDFLITMDTQYHLIRPLQDRSGRVPSLFLYLALNKERANLGLARLRLSRIEADLEV
ncbi:hypothetical protein M1L60_25050 [Actinoplanes sp. TRM 88003]|uniref:Roadblock/LC7 domain-containing protein n=1 Tax=Paractinoplanes aksuensis TaxID=2939490 RepID=A0ABT1DSS5_9ACTN|nr:hypothetical protein [Actinoplanes aksuensis]MCO8273870.1 hypothetical protein [Actinoplanes aksuensis]